MNNRSYCNRGPQLQTIKKMHCLARYLAAACLLLGPAVANAGDAPQWMHALVNVPLPAHDEKTDAVQMYYEKIVSVQSTDKIKTTVREAYKILRPGRRDAGIVVDSYYSHEKITSIHGC